MGVAVGHGDRTPKIIGLSFDTPPLSGAGPQSRRIWLKFRYATSSGAGLSFDTPPYRGPGPKQGGCGLSFDTPPYRGPRPKQGGYGLSFDTPPYRGPGPNQGGYGLSFDTPHFGGRAHSRRICLRHRKSAIESETAELFCRGGPDRLENWSDICFSQLRRGGCVSKHPPRLAHETRDLVAPPWPTDPRGRSTPWFFQWCLALLVQKPGVS